MVHLVGPGCLRFLRSPLLPECLTPKTANKVQIHGTIGVTNKIDINLKLNLDKTIGRIGRIPPVSSVGRASDYRAGGLGFEPQTGPTLRVLK